MNCEILAIGTEILLGDIVNTNAQFLAENLASIGVDVYRQSVIGDNPERLKQELERAFKQSDLVITTGGLGPTKDDLSKEIAAAYFNTELKLFQPALDWIMEIFKKRDIPYTINNEKQAFLPEGSHVLMNKYGTAPGFILEKNQKTLIMLPGPPREMRPLFLEQVKPYLKNITNCMMYSKVIKMSGIGESTMETKIRHLIDEQTNPTIAPYAKTGQVTLRLTAKAENDKVAQQLIDPLKEKIYDILGDYIYGEDEQTLEGSVANLLNQHRLTIATAESCTGGLLAGTLVNYPGVSEVFNEGYVTYSNEAKIKNLGVPKELIEQHGAVSREVAKAMAEGVAHQAKADIGVGITGIAGPGGGTDTKPVGLIYIGVSFKGHTEVKRLNLGHERDKNRIQTVISALTMVRNIVVKSVKK